MVKLCHRLQLGLGLKSKALLSVPQQTLAPLCVYWIVRNCCLLQDFESILREEKQKLLAKTDSK